MNLFFSRRQGAAGTATAGDVYWLDAKCFDQFRREEGDTQ